MNIEHIIYFSESRKGPSLLPTRGARLRCWLASELELEPEHADLLDRLVGLGITPETAPAFESLPLVEIAWADGAVDAEERWRVLASATAFGLELGRPAHAQLELWLSRRPPEVLFRSWYEFAERRLRRPDAADRARRLLDGVKDVAESAGGLLGLWPVSRAEREVIGRVRRALGARSTPARAASGGEHA
jgi:hypothetical protein